MEPLISVRGLVNRFGVQLLHDGVDLDLYPREILGVVGGNGTGKSVLMRSIIGLQRPQAGSVRIAGHDVLKLSPPEFRNVQKLWGVLFQKGALFSNLTVTENIAFQFRERTDLSEAQILALSRMKIELVGLSADAGAKYPSQLSGGMNRRAALARALALDPKILFLDEPTAGLDPISSDGFDKLIRDLVDQIGVSVFMITHDLTSLFSICDRVAVLVDHKVRMGSMQEHGRDKNPWMQEYFHSRRALAAARS
jgi:phospholipid/cholesterol/gamma-HCH transport system ATP-binding protein